MAGGRDEGSCSSRLLGKPFGIVLFQLLDATQFTIYLSLIAFVGGGLLGLVDHRSCGSRPRSRPQAVASGYIWLFQSVPLLMLLFLLGLGVPQLLGIDIDPWLAAAVALTLYASAYLADVWRGAVEAVPAGPVGRRPGARPAASCRSSGC